MSELLPDSFAGVRGFARAMLRGDALRLAARPGEVRVFDTYALEAILFREACWQVELIAMWPGATVPRHRHLRCDSCDLLLAGVPERICIADALVDAKPRGSRAANLVRVPKAQWHDGEPGSNGSVYLSFQKWDGVPGFISEDWEAWPSLA